MLSLCQDIRYAIEILSQYFVLLSLSYALWWEIFRNWFDRTNLSNESLINHPDTLRSLYACIHFISMSFSFIQTYLVWIVKLSGTWILPWFYIAINIMLLRELNFNNWNTASLVNDIDIDVQIKCVLDLQDTCTRYL